MSAKRIGLIALLFVLISMFMVVAAENTEAETAQMNSAYELVAENERLALYLRRDIMAIIIETKSTGARLYSAVQNPDDMRDNSTWKGFYQSGIVMEYIENAKPTPVQADLLNLENIIEYTMLENGFSARVTFPTIGISYEATVTLDEQGIHVSIPQDKFVESMSDKKAVPGQKNEYRIATFYIFPFLGHSYLGEDEGYIFVPDGQGALIALQNNGGRFNSPYDNAVYGDNVGSKVNTFYEWYMEPEQILMPVYGLARTEEQIAFLGVIEEGDAAARIKAYPNGVTTKFDWVASQFVYRYVYNQPTVNSRQKSASSSSVNMVSEEQRDFDISLHFLIAEGDEANYAGMAKMYRNYLIEQGAFDKAEAQSFGMRIDFFGAEQENDLFGKKDIAMTTFEQAEEILEDLQGAGVSEITVGWRGWQEKGMTGGVPIRSYSVSSVLGGRSGMNQLLDQAESMGILMMPEADLLSINLDTNPVALYDAFKLVTGTQWEKPTYKKVYEHTYMLMPEVSLENGRRLIRQLGEHGYKALSVCGITSLVSDYEDKDDVYRDSSWMMTIYKQLFEEASEVMDVYMACPNAYLWRYATALYDMPLGPSDYIFTAYDVPFMSIVLSGQIPYYAEYTNFQANSTRFLLQLIEQGAFPSFLLTMEDPILLVNSNSNDVFSSQYELYREMIVQWYDELTSVFSYIGGASIEQHTRQGDMVKVVWSNGVTVYINYDDIPGQMDQVTLDGFSYKVVN